jgi:hypothetical protein
VSISKKNRDFFETLRNIEAIKRDLATGSGQALGFDPRRRAEAMVWVREKNARAQRADRWKALVALSIVLAIAATIIKGMIKG